MTPNRENRASFLAVITPLFAPSTVRRIMSAYDRSKEKHRYQKRKDGERYFEHARFTALILIVVLGCVDPDLICAAFLHDTIEDTRCTPEELEQLFGERVCQIVVRLTKKPKDGYAERLLTYGEWPELMVKLCDRLHNLRTMGEGTSPGWRKKQYLETRDVYIPIFENLLDQAPRRYTKNIVAALEEVKQRVTAGLTNEAQSTP